MQVMLCVQYVETTGETAGENPSTTIVKEVFIVVRTTMFDEETFDALRLFMWPLRKEKHLYK
jgi:hypothetical protein